MSSVTNPVKEVEHFGSRIAPYGDIIFNLEVPDPAVPLNSPRPMATGTKVFSPWGESNDFPQEVIRKVEQDTEIGALLDWKGRLLQGKDVIAIRKVSDEAKKDFKKERINDPDTYDFLSSIAFQRYWREACTDFTWFQNIYLDMIKNKMGDKTTTLSCRHAAWTRLGKMNENGTITNAYVSAEWPTAKHDGEYTMKFAVVNSYNSEVVKKIKDKRALKLFINLIQIPRKHGDNNRFYIALSCGRFLYPM